MDRDSFEHITTFDSMAPVLAIKAVLDRSPASAVCEIQSAIVEEITKNMIEENTEVLSSPRSVAMAHRLFEYIIHQCLRVLAPEKPIQLIHGAAWRPLPIDGNIVTDSVSFDRKIYYEYLIYKFEKHGDRYATAAGDHYNLSAPWVKEEDVSRVLIQTNARMRFLTSVFMPFTNISPFHFTSSCVNENVKYYTVLKAYEGA